MKTDTKLAQWLFFAVSVRSFAVSDAALSGGEEPAQTSDNSMFVAGMCGRFFGSDGWNRTTDLGVMNP